MTAVLESVLIIISNTSVTLKSSRNSLLYQLRDIKRGREERQGSTTHTACILFHHGHSATHRIPVKIIHAVKQDGKRCLTLCNEGSTGYIIIMVT